MAKKMPEIGEYKYGFHDKDVSIFRSERGLTKEIVEEISRMKEEPQMSCFLITPDSAVSTTCKWITAAAVISVSSAQRTIRF